MGIADAVQGGLSEGGEIMHCGKLDKSAEQPANLIEISEISVVPRLDFNFYAPR